MKNFSENDSGDLELLDFKSWRYPDFPLPKDERERIESLAKLSILNQGLDQTFLNKIAKLAEQVIGAGLGVVNIIAETEQKTVNDNPLNVVSLPRNQSFCNYTVAAGRPFYVKDATVDERFSGNPLVSNAPNIRSYIGVPITDASGMKLGAVCCLNSEIVERPSKLQIEKLNLLADLAHREIVSQQKNKELSLKITKLNLEKQLRANLAKELENQRQAALEATNEINKSIEYASRLQKSLLPKDYPEDFDVAAHWAPRDLVGGDLYNFRVVDEIVLFSVIDCTGHGVPGSFVSAIARSLIDRAISEYGLTNPGNLLNQVNRLMKQTLQQIDGKTGSNEGFDGGFCFFDRRSRTFSFSGAKSSLIMIDRNSEVSILEGDRKSVGSLRNSIDEEYQSHSIKIDNQSFFLFSDGITDVMGAETPRLFGKRRLCGSFSKHYHAGISCQSLIDSVIQDVEKYGGRLPQRDDMTGLLFTLKVSRALD